MHNIKLIAAGLVVASSVGCVETIPTINATGRYNVVFLNGSPAISFEYQSNEDCANAANKILKLDENTRRGVASGNIALTCSNSDAVSSLKYESTIKNVLTGRVFPTRTYSESSCIFFGKSNTDKSLKYSCLDD